MKRLIKNVLFLAIAGLLFIGCEKSELNNVENQINTQNQTNKSLKSNNKLLETDYPIVIIEDLNVEENLNAVITNLNENEYLHSTAINGEQHHEIRLNNSNDDFPDNQYDPSVTFGCEFPNTNATCLAAIIFWHQYNLVHCDGSGIGYSNGTLWVHGWGCEETA